jgi:uncharacterized lipoprotein YmbA
MTRSDRLGWLVAALLLLAAAACGSSKPPIFYTLDSTADPIAAPAATYGVIVGPVSVPASVDRPEFVVRVAPNRVEIDEFNRWAAPLGESIARTVASDLSVLLGTPDVANAPFANFDPTYRVTINVQGFDSRPGEAAELDAVWTVRSVSDGKTRMGRTRAKKTVEGPQYEALAAAHSRALAEMSRDIAAAIRAAAAGS